MYNDLQKKENFLKGTLFKYLNRQNNYEKCSSYMDILVSRTLYMSCQAGPGMEPGPSALKASALPIELMWQTNASFRRLYQCQSKIYSTFLSKITKYNLIHLEAIPRSFDCEAMILPLDQLVR